MHVFDIIKSYSISSLCSLLWFYFMLQTLDFLLLPLCLQFIALFPSHGRLLSHFKHKARQTLLSVSCLNHGVLLQQPKITKIVFFMTWGTENYYGTLSPMSLFLSSAFFLIPFSLPSFVSNPQLSNSP